MLGKSKIMRKTSKKYIKNLIFLIIYQFKMSTINKITENTKKIALDFKLKVNHFLLVAFTFVVALSWNDTIKAGIKELYPKNEEMVFSLKLLYSLILTFIIVIIMMYILEPDTQTSLPKTA
jgi:hypothetical protein